MVHYDFYIGWKYAPGTLCYTAHRLSTPVGRMLEHVEEEGQQQQQQ